MWWNCVHIWWKCHRNVEFFVKSVYFGHKSVFLSGFYKIVSSDVLIIVLNCSNFNRISVKMAI